MRIAVKDSTLIPSDNEWGVPSLDPKIQPASIMAPIVSWGSVSRAKQHGGTWVFYVDDYRFSSPALAEQVADSFPAAAAEPNYSVFDWTPRAEALWSVYRKRRVAWELQRRGVDVFVDLCMPEPHLDLALLGVPKGWRAYATRGFEARPNDVVREYLLAAKHAGGNPLLLVYGGGRGIAEVVRTMPGAVHCADYNASRTREPRWAKAAAKAPEEPPARSEAPSGS